MRKGDRVQRSDRHSNRSGDGPEIKPHPCRSRLSLLGKTQTSSKSQSIRRNPHLAWIDNDSHFVRDRMPRDHAFSMVYHRRMRLQRILGFSAALALATAVVAGLSALQVDDSVGTVGWQVVTRFVVVQVYGFFGLFMARDSGIEGSLLMGEKDWADSVRGIVNWGILPGLVIGVINYLFFFAYRYSPFVLPRIREMKNGYDAFILSLESSLTEESIYRLFIMSSMLYLFHRLYSKLNPKLPAGMKQLPTALALALSAIVFGIAHGNAGFTAAFFGGMILGWIYLKSGIESSIAAHFAANLLFFTASYLF